MFTLLFVEVGIAVAILLVLFDLRREVRRNRQLIASYIAHQMKTPLTTILGTLRIVESRRDRMSPETLTEMLRSAIQQAHELDHLITGMVSLEDNDVKAS